MATQAGTSAGVICTNCGRPGDVFVREELYCARCALAYHLEALQRMADEDDDEEVEGSREATSIS